MCLNNSPRIWMCICIYVCMWIMNTCYARINQTHVMSKSLDFSDWEDCIRIRERNSLAEMFIHNEKNLCNLKGLKDTAFSKWGKGCTKHRLCHQSLSGQHKSGGGWDYCAGQPTTLDLPTLIRRNTLSYFIQVAGVRLRQAGYPIKDLETWNPGARAGTLHQGNQGIGNCQGAKEHVNVSFCFSTLSKVQVQ